MDAGEARGRGNCLSIVGVGPIHSHMNYAIDTCPRREVHFGLVEHTPGIRSARRRSGYQRTLLWTHDGHTNFDSADSTRKDPANLKFMKKVSDSEGKLTAVHFRPA